VLPGQVRIIEGRDDPFDGWWSDTYGAWSPAARIEAVGLTEGPIVWSILVDGEDPPQNDTNSIADGSLSWSVTWDGDEAQLEVPGYTAKRVPLAAPRGGLQE
jgi:hypothetical protein